MTYRWFDSVFAVVPRHTHQHRRLVPHTLHHIIVTLATIVMTTNQVCTAIMQQLFWYYSQAAVTVYHVGGLDEQPGLKDTQRDWSRSDNHGFITKLNLCAMHTARSSTVDGQGVYRFN